MVDLILQQNILMPTVTVCYFYLLLNIYSETLYFYIEKKFSTEKEFLVAKNELKTKIFLV